MLPQKKKWIVYFRTYTNFANICEFQK